MKPTPTITIKQEQCIQCNHCVDICPSKIFTIQGSSVTPIHEDTCIRCGHCVAICPSSVISHSDFSANTIRPIDYNRIPQPEQVMELIRSRRSNRAFSDKTIPDEWLQQIIKAAHCAPTASNLQQVRFVLITQPDQLALVSQITINRFKFLLNKLENPFLKPILKRIVPANYSYVPLFKRLIAAFEAGEDLILRQAKAVILIYTPQSCRFGCEDSNLAYQNASLMAESLGVAQFYTGFVCSVAKQTQELSKALGIDGTIHAGMALAIPKFRFHNYIERQEPNLKVM